MRSTSSTFFAMVFFVLVSCNDQSTDTDSTSTASTLSVDSARSMISANNLKLGSLLKAGDTTGWAEMYTADGCAYPAGMEKVCGKEAISAFMGYAYRQLGARDIKVNTEEILQGNGFLVEVGTYQMYDSTGKLIDKGKTMVVWKEENGTLKLHRDFFNTDLAPPSGN